MTPRVCTGASELVKSSQAESEPAVYAIVRSGGGQQKVAVGDVIEIDQLGTTVGDSLSLPVVLVVDGETVTSDSDALSKFDVSAEVLGATKGPKIHILKYKNKTGYRKRQGHRQHYTKVKVTAINTADSTAENTADTAEKN
jgi:large subunit ribosomal protein L21